MRLTKLMVSPEHEYRYAFATSVWLRMRRPRRRASSLFDLGNDVIQCQITEQLVAFLGVITIAYSELANESHRIYQTNLAAQYTNCRLCHLSQRFWRSLQAACVKVDSHAESIASI